jgi:outer membrane immunogenic protein
MMICGVTYYDEGMMKKVILGAATALVFSSSAFAADIYSREAVSYKDAPMHVLPYIWSGFYVGANIGYGWSDNKQGDVSVVEPGVFDDRGTFNSDFDGIFGGVQIGYNQQSGRIVFGLEADIQVSDFEATETAKQVFAIAPNITFDSKLNVDWFGTVRARLGLAHETALFYITGGLAYGGVDLKSSFTGFTGPLAANSDEIMFGYAVGAGVEVALDSRWSLKGEYLYVDLGEIDARAFDGPEIFDANADVAFHTVRVGLNYKLHDEIVPLK